MHTLTVLTVLTVLTAIFLPLNLITGFFGMNFDGWALIHSSTGIWVTIGAMVADGVGLLAFLICKRYLGTAGR